MSSTTGPLPHQPFTVTPNGDIAPAKCITEIVELIKPPPGIMPKYIWRETRVTELADAINRYARSGRYHEIPTWAEELKALIEEILADPKHPK